ncbi:DUF7927 domain-containing protein [Actinomadura harenae]|uniref:DUF11 domain-containing protein n=1 Tax=Actinomadura harenae TaxID=2483351 RepID=A0A3M2LJW8_9ACTN|nr:DUF11 domain-containing protein [Actinomadura harenae]RMI37416.1 DUF11 domain-containing protein [Actinomadura harenae]
MKSWTTASAALLVVAASLFVPPVASGPASAQAAHAARALAAGGSDLLNETFEGATVQDPGFLALNDACLTGAPSGPDTTGPGAHPLGTCSEHQYGPVPPIGQVPGYLQLTDASGARTGGVVYNRPLPANGGLDVTFEQYQYGGIEGGGDGIAFFLTDGAGELTQTGAFGGSLGYAQRSDTPGVDHGYLGLGLDTYGNYAVDFEGRGTECPEDQRSPGEFQVYDRPPNNVTLRGPGHDLDHYCYLAGTGTTTQIGTDPDGNKLFGSTLPGRLHEDGTDTEAAKRTVHVVVSASVRPIVTVEIDFHDGNGFVPVLSKQMPEDAPRTYKFGFTASTGSATDVHLIRLVSVKSAEPLGALNIVKQVDRSTPQPPVYHVGDVVPYHFVVTNTGAGPLSNVTVTDPKVSGITCPRTTLGAMGEPTASMTCTGTHTITAADAAAGHFDNAATASGTDASGAVVESEPSEVSVPTEPPAPVPDPVIEKTASTDRVKLGDEVTYTIRVHNQGNGPLVDGHFTDDLTGVLDDADLVGTPNATIGTVTLNGTQLEWTGSLDPGQDAVITYTVRTRTGGDRTMVNAVSGLGNCMDAGGAPPCGTTVDIVEEPPPPPNPVVTKTASVSQVDVGDEVTYTVRVINEGAGPLVDGHFTDDLTDVLDDADLVGTPNATIGTATVSGSKLEWTGSLDPGQEAVITYTVRAHAGGDGHLRNSVSGLGNCLNGGGQPPCGTDVTVVEQPPPPPNPVVQKTASVSQVNPGDEVTYTVKVTNEGQGPLVDGHFTDDLTDVLDDAVLVGTPSATVGSVTLSGANLEWTGSLDPGQEAVITYTVRAERGGNGHLRNSVSGLGNCLNGGGEPPCGTDVTVEEPPPPPEPNPVIEKSASASSVQVGDEVTFTVRVRNEGEGPLVDGQLTDDLSAVLDDGVLVGTPSATVGSVTLSGSDLVWTGSLDPGQETVITYTVRAESGGDGHMRNVVSGLGNCLNAGGEPPCGTDVTVEEPPPPPEPNPVIEKSASAASVQLGDEVTFTVRVRNEGEGPLVNGQLTDDLSAVLDDGVLVGTPSATVGSVALSGSDLVWTGSLDPGQEAVITYTVRAEQGGDGHMRNVVSGLGNCLNAGGEPPCGTDVIVEEPPPPPEPNPVIEKSASANTVQVGDEVTFTVRVRNEGEGPLVNGQLTDDLSGVLDDGVLVGTPSTTVGSVTLSGSDLVWTGSLDPGQEAVITYTVRAESGGDGHMRNVVSGLGNCLNAGGEPPCGTDVTVEEPPPPPEPNPVIEKSASANTVQLGDEVTFTVKVRNEGQGPLVNGQLTDDLSAVLDDGVLVGTPSATVGSVALSGSDLVWTGSLDPGQEAVITYTVRAEPGGDGRMRNVVSGLGNCLNAGGEPPCGTDVTVEEPPPLTPNPVIEKSASANTVQVGDEVTFTVKVRNEGEGPLVDGQLTDDLSAVLDDGVLVGTPSATVGSVALSGSDLVWTGSLDPGQEAVITYTVRAESGGDGHMRNVVSGLGNCLNAGGEPPCGTDVTVEEPPPPPEPNPVIEKSASANSVQLGDEVTFTVRVRNEGEGPLVNGQLTDDLSAVLDDGVLVGTPSATVGSVALSGSDLVWTGSLNPGQEAVITYTVRAEQGGDGHMRNVVSGLGNCLNAGGEPPCGTDVIVEEPPPPPEPNPVVEKSASVNTVQVGNEVTFTVKVRNEGEGPLVNGQLTDDLSGVLDDGVLVGTPSATVGSVTLSGSNLVWTGSLDPGQETVITYTVRAESGGDGHMRNVVSGLGNCLESGGEPPCGTDVTVEEPPPPPEPNPVVEKSASVNTVQPGHDVTFTIRVRNEGEGPLVNGHLTDDLSGVLDDGVLVGTPSATIGTVSVSGSNLEWTGSLDPGQETVITYTVKAQAGGDGQMRNVVSGLGNCLTRAGEPPCSTDVTVEEVPPPPEPNPVIEKTASADSVQVGDEVTYTIKVTNEGEGPLVNGHLTDDLSGVLDDGVLVGTPSATIGSVTLSGSNLEWTGSLDPGQQAVITYTVRAAKGGDGQMRNAVSGLGNCLNGGGEPPCGTVVTVEEQPPPPPPNPVVEKTASKERVRPGDEVTFTIRVRNAGAGPLVDGRLTDDLAGVLDDGVLVGTPSATIGSVTLSGSNLEWTGSLDPDQEAVITYTVRAAKGGDGHMRNAVSGLGNCESGGGEPPCGTVVEVEEKKPPKPPPPSRHGRLTITKWANRSYVRPGQRVVYRIKVENTGDGTLRDASFRDDLRAVLRRARLVERPRATRGHVRFERPVLHWTGTLRPGQSAIIEYTVVARCPGRLWNRVVSSVPRTNCPPRGRDWRCRMVVTVVPFPQKDA